MSWTREIIHPPRLAPESLAPAGFVIARHYRSGNFYRVIWEDGVLTQMILAPKPKSHPNGPDLWIAPSLVDLQVNGYAAVDFQHNAVTAQDLSRAVQALRGDGCGRILLTLITAEWPTLMRRLQRYRELVQADPELRRAIVGWHLEGPFLSPERGFAGAHRPDWMLDPTPQHLAEVKSITGEDPVLLSLAPEHPGAVAAIRAARAFGFRISFGHTNASAAQLQAAVQAGASLFTHLGNGCPQLLDRHDNIIWRALDLDELTLGVIPDGIHVSPALFRLIHKAHDGNSIYWTTDAMSAAAAEPGLRRLGELTVRVQEDGVVRHPTTGGFAGSSLRPLEGVRRGAAMLGKPWQEVWDHLSTIPARVMGLPSGLEIGSAAGFCLLADQ